MIRHPVAPDFSAEETASMNLLDKFPDSSSQTSIPARVEAVHSTAHGHAAGSGPSFAYYAAPLFALLLVVSIAAVLALVKLHRETVKLRGIRDRYRAFLARPAAGIGAETGLR